MQVPVIAQERLAGVGTLAVGVYALAVQLEVLFLDGRGEDLHEALRVHVVRHGLHRVPAVLYLLHFLFTVEGAGILVAGVVAGHDAFARVEVFGLDYPAPRGRGHLGLSCFGRFRHHAGDLAEHGEADALAKAGVHEAAVALHGFVRAEPRPAVDIHEVVARRRLAHVDVFARHADELVVRVEHLIQHHIFADVVLDVDLQRVGRGEGLGDGGRFGKLFLPFVLIHLAEAFAQGFLVLLVGHHFRGDFEEVALALHVGYAGAAHELLHLGVVRVQAHQLAYAGEGLAAVVVAAHVRTLGAGHLLFKVGEIDIGLGHFAVGSGAGIGLERAEGQPQKKSKREFLHSDSCL